MKVLKWIGIVVAAAITILLLLNAYFVWSTGTRLEQRLAELRQGGNPVQLSDLARDPIAPEKNADAFLRRAADDLDAIEKELRVSFPKIGFPTQKLTAMEQEKLQKLFAAFPKVIPTLEQAADCPDSDPQLDCTLPPSRFLEPFTDHTMKRRAIYRVLRARSALLTSQSRLDDAITTQILALRLTRTWRREPFIMGFLVTAVCEQTAMDGINRVLQAGPVSLKSRKSLDRELALHDTMEGYIWALKSERAFALASARETPGPDIWITRAFVNDLSLKLIELFDQHLKLAAQPFSAVIAAKTKPPAPRAGMNPLMPLAKLLEPALNAAREPAERTRAISRSLRVLTALQSHAAAGSAPEPKLSELGLPAEATIDPFNDDPLHIKKLPEGWIVYSVGSNLMDDGGKLDGRADVGIGPVSRSTPDKAP